MDDTGGVDRGTSTDDNANRLMLGKVAQTIVYAEFGLKTKR